MKERDLHVPVWLLDGEHGIGNASVYRSPRTWEFARKIYKKVKAPWGHHVAAELDKELIKALSSAGAVAIIDGDRAFDVPLADEFSMVRTGSLRVVLKGRLKDPGYQGISLDRFHSGFQTGTDRTSERSVDRRVRWAADARAWLIHDLRPAAGGNLNSFWLNLTHSYGTQNERTRTESGSAETKISHVSPPGRTADHPGSQDARRPARGRSNPAGCDSSPLSALWYDGRRPAPRVRDPRRGALRAPS